MFSVEKQKGFTLIEIVLVLVLMGILSTIALTKYYDLQKKAEYDSACAYANQFCSDMNGRVAELLIEGQSCVNAYKTALTEMMGIYDSATDTPNGMMIYVGSFGSLTSPTGLATIPVIAKDGTPYYVPSSLVSCNKLAFVDLSKGH